MADPISYLEDVTVDLVDSMGSDDSIIRAAQVSVVGANNPDDFERTGGLINYLMREHHGSPFEHNSMTFYCKAPIFVFREFMRHRVGFSYNEMSGRYTTLEPEFYVPGPDRPITNGPDHKPSKPQFVPGSPEQIALLSETMMDTYETTWTAYKKLLDNGIANEVARMVLPVGIMSQMYVTMNLRSAFNFLSLRTLGHPDASFVSRPQQEIAMVADKIEDTVAVLFPLAYAKFNANGRVAP